MLSDLIAAYVYATSRRERDLAERNCRKLGIDKHTLNMMAAAFMEDNGHELGRERSAYTLLKGKQIFSES